MSADADSTIPGTGRPRRVLFLSAAERVGGAERSLYELVCALPREQVEAHVCVPSESPLSRLFALAGIPVHPVPLRRFRRSRNPLVLAGQLRALHLGAKSIGELVRQQGLDLLHANTDATALVAWEVSRETGLPFIWHCRDLHPLGLLARILAGATTCAVAISEAVENHLLQQGVKRDRVRCLPNGIDLTRFHGPEKRAEVRARTRGYLGISPETPLLIDIGAWVPWKRHEHFLDALAEVRRQRPDVVGLLVGSDLFHENRAYVSQLERHAERLRLSDGGLLVLQQREDVPDLLAASDVLVSASDNEPFGRVLVEAGASGVPVVSTDSGAKREIVAHGETGLLTPPADPRRMADACLELLAQPERLEAMGSASRRLAADRYDVRHLAGAVAALYRELLGPPPS
jgi:glycosyltransferase involved in cell wall biosynthesis